MLVAITGSSGLIGSALVARLEELGHEVRRVVRSGGGPGTISWDPQAGTIDAAGFEGVAAVVHLAGESIAAVRWTAAKRRRILESRTTGTSLLATTLAGLGSKPSVLVSASGVNHYGDRGEEELTEASGRGDGFLADVTVAWEDATIPAADAGIRTVVLRNGVVLAGHGGALGPQLPLFKLGLGARFGDGRQWLPWISLPDEVDAIVHLLTADVHGPVNACAPNPVRNADFTRILGRVLGRPAVLRVPRFAPRVVLGRQLADELLLVSMRAVPRTLLDSGFRFRHDDVESALRAVLDRPG
jgi:uncharacterized protein